jgi:hypothetical protein
MVHGLTEEVIGAYSARDMVSRAIVAFWLVVFFRELDGDLELGENIAFNVQGNLRRIGRRRCITHKSA